MSHRPAVAQGWAQARLRSAGVASPQAEARILLQYVTGLKPTELLVAPELDAELFARFEEIVAERCAGVPLQHLTGEAWFRGTRLLVGPGVFIPRPETELVAQAAIDQARRLPEARVVELCAGSGAISAALVNEVPGVRVIAVEREPAAAEWLNRNLVDSTAVVVQADMSAALPELNGQIDIVVANPPYIPPQQFQELPTEVRDHDPPTALIAENDGMAAIEVVCRVAARLLRPGGLVIIEHGDDQAARAVELLHAAGFVDGARHRDLAGRERFVTGWQSERDAQA